MQVCACIYAAAYGAIHTAGEGFNLRRDVHMRATTLIRLLQEKSSNHNWVLVLPPWPRLYHWKTSSQVYEPWDKFFDIASLNEFVPSIEFDDYLEQNGHVIDEVRKTLVPEVVKGFCCLGNGIAEVSGGI